MDLGLIAGVGKILGGLFSKKPKDDTAFKNRESVMGQAQGAREAAEKYGFNPLTLLQNATGGGLSSGGIAPLASVELITGGLQDLAQAKKNQEDTKLAHQRKDAELQAREIEHAAVSRDAVSSPFAGPPRNATSVGVPVLVQPRLSADREVTTPTEVTGFRAFGQDIKPDIRFDDAEIAEARYGDVGSAVYGIGVAAADAYNTLRRPMVLPSLRRDYAAQGPFDARGAADAVFRQHGIAIDGYDVEGNPLVFVNGKPRKADGKDSDGRPYWIDAEGNRTFNPR